MSSEIENMVTPYTATVEPDAGDSNCLRTWFLYRVWGIEIVASVRSRYQRGDYAPEPTVGKYARRRLYPLFGPIEDEQTIGTRNTTAADPAAPRMSQTFTL